MVRPGRKGLEVLLTQRPSTMAFGPDLHVFPGGAVDPGDSAPTAVQRSVVSPAEARRLLGGDCSPEEAVGAFIAASRELWEEAGIALVRPRSATPDGATLAAARRALLSGERGIGDVARDLDLELRTDLLVPLSRWVTPPFLPRRFDARFFVAELPADVEPAFAEQEVVAHRWATPRAALDAMAARDIELWPPTSTTLQQLEHVESLSSARARLVPGPSSPIRFEQLDEVVVLAVLPGAGGVGGQTVNAYVVGRRELVVVDPGDPSEAATDGLLALAAGRGGRIAAVALTSANPDHAAGAQGLSLALGVPLFAGVGGGHDLPLEVVELAEGDLLPAGDVPLVALAAPGPRADHTAWVVSDVGGVIAGDLVGPGPSRSVLGPPDVDAWLASLDRVAALAPRRLLPGHGHVPSDPTTALDTQRRRLPPKAYTSSGSALERLRR